MMSLLDFLPGVWHSKGKHDKLVTRIDRLFFNTGEKSILFTYSTCSVKEVVLFKFYEFLQEFKERYLRVLDSKLGLISSEP